MKKLSKLLAMLTILAMVLSLGGTAFASGEASADMASAVAITGDSVETDDTYFTGTATETTVSDFAIDTNGRQMVGLKISGDGAEKIRIENGIITMTGIGTAISLFGNADTQIDGVVVWNKGRADGVSAAGQSNTLVTNTVIYGEQDPATYRRTAPFALGLAGSSRVTNAVGNSVITYEDSLVVSGSWAPLSTDSGVDVCLTTRNVLAGVGWLEVAQDGVEYTATKEVNGVLYGFTLGDSANYNSGYVSYCDSGFHNYYYDSQFYGTDYVIILSTFKSSATMVNDECYSDRIGIMWHKNQGGTVDMTGGSMYAEQALFMMKGYSDVDTDGCYTNLIVDGTELTVGSGGVLLQTMTSDDCGLNYEALQIPAVEDDFSQVECLLGTMVQKTYTEGFPPTIMYVFELNGEEVGVSAAEYDAFVAANPEAEAVMVEYEPQQTSTAVFKNLSVTGDIYNAVWQAYQAIDVTFENAQITGVISSAWANHVDAEGNALPGGTVIPADSSLDCHLGMGRVKNTVAPTVNNPVYLTLTDGAVWNVTGESYLAKLTIDVTSAIPGAVMTVDGVETPIAAGTYEGEIVITPAASGDVTWADFQAWIVSILPEISPFPDAVGELVMATTGWADMDVNGGGPWEKIFGEEYFNTTTWDEFVANGGVGTYNADYVDLPAEDAPAASGEAS